MRDTMFVPASFSDTEDRIMRAVSKSTFWVVIPAMMLLFPTTSYGLRWDFDTDGDLEGWRINGGVLNREPGTILNLSVADGVLKNRIGDHPQGWQTQAMFLSPKLDMDASLFDRLRIRVRTGSAIATVEEIQMVWRTPESPSPFELTPESYGAHKLSLMKAFVLADEWQEVEVTGFASRPTWTGQLLQFSITFRFPFRSPPEIVEVDWVELTGLGEELSGIPDVPLRGGPGVLFRPFISHNIGYSGYCVAGGDMDGDGDTDLVVGGEVHTEERTEQGRLGVLLNDGEGEFRVHTMSCDVPQGIWTEDLDLDGDLDVVMTIGGMDEVEVYMNRGDGGLVGGRRYPVGSDPRSIWAGDVDSDGDVDLVVANWRGELGGPRRGEDTVTVLLNEGEGQFGERMDYRVGEHPALVWGGDVDMDGDADLVVGCVGYVTREGVTWHVEELGEIYVFRNEGRGMFSDAEVYRVGLEPLGMCAGDFTGDGFLDLVVVNHFGTNELSLLFNRGDGRFAEAESLIVGDDPMFATPGDFDGDGDLDLAVGSKQDASVIVLTNDGRGQFTTEGMYPVSGVSSGRFVGDLNRDGLVDLVVADPQGQSLSVLFHRGIETVVEKETDGGRRSYPDEIVLCPSYPNPFNASTTIRYDVPIAGRMKLCIYDVVGQRIRTLADGRMEAGFHRAIWDGKDGNGRQVSSGIYLCQLEVQTRNPVFVDARKMILLR